ncbi:MAG: hypothetical protein ACHREM_10550 [Polyangiales bacterium]
MSVARALGFAAISIVACARPTTPSAPVAAVTIEYALTVGDTLDSISIVAKFPDGAPAGLHVWEDSAAFLRDIDVRAAGASDWQRVSVVEDLVRADACAKGPCEARYRFALLEAAARFRDVDVALSVEGLVESPPSAWLLVPVSTPTGRAIRLEISTHHTLAFSTGLRQASAAELHAFSFIAGDLPKTPFTVFGAMSLDLLTIGAAHVVVARPPRSDATDEERTHASERAWIKRSANVTAEYLGQFPIDALALVLPPGGLSGHPRDGAFGWTMGNGGAAIAIEAPKDESDANLAADWVVVHEMMHLGFPSLGDEDRWLREGLATYTSELARAQFGSFPIEKFWAEMLEMLPYSLPNATCDENPYVPMYWRGARFAFLADLEIRKRTKGEKSLRDALAAVVAAGGNVSVRWPAKRAFEIGDAATGTTVLQESYATWSAGDVATDLPALFARLGVGGDPKHVSFDDTAPDAATRRALTEPRKGSLPSVLEEHL